MEWDSSYSVTDFKSTPKSHGGMPPDVNPEGAEEIMERYRSWTRRLHISAPILHGSHFTPLIVLGILSIVFGVMALRGMMNKHAFWGVFPECMAALFSVTTMCIVEFVLFPNFWKARAKEMVDTGVFDSTQRKGGNGTGMTLLELGCGDAKASIYYARAILDRQRDIERMSMPSAMLPTFIGYDGWSKLSRLPNNPRVFLYNLLCAGVPRFQIIANRKDNVAHVDPTTKMPTLPYPNDSISLIISNVGMSELVGIKKGAKKRRALLDECVRVLEPGGKMVLVESEGVYVGDTKYKSKWSDSINGASVSYRKVLVDIHKWPAENVLTKNENVINYLVATKPAVGTARLH
jgi:hypothetical protein